jgi:hypothetical protein
MGRIDAVDELEANMQWGSNTIWTRYDSGMPEMYCQMTHNTNCNTL